MLLWNYVITGAAAMQKLLTEQDGFTLLELLTVIISIIILVGLVYLLH